MTFWNGKVAIVAGGSAGLGKAVAGALARGGAQVVIAARDGPRLAAAAEELAGSGEVSGTATDCTDGQQVDELVRTTVERFDRLDAVVNCVGQSSRARVLDVSAEQYRQSLEVNFLSAVHCARAAAEHLIDSQGHLINIGSLAAKTASPHMALYSPGKFALAAYTQQLRLELGPRGLHVLLVCPGPIKRGDGEARYAEQSKDLSASAAKPGGGARLKGLAPGWLAGKILQACERRKAELIVPAKARWLFAIAALSPSLGDWLLKRATDA